MADNAEVLTDEQVARMLVPEIKDELRRRRLRLSGRKRELLQRLMAALRLEREHGARDDDDEEVDYDEAEDDEDEVGGGQDEAANNDDPWVIARGNDEEDERNRENPVIRRNRREAEPSRTLLLLKDVENSLDKFSGDDLLSISRWIEDFEEMAEVCGWTDVHKVAFGKKLLTGSALAFMRQERCTKTWAKFKKALKDEFEDEVTDQQIHRELTQRKKKHDETLQQYMYKMREIAAQGKVDTQSMIEYIIQGIPDEVTTKAVLYGARNLQQLREHFKQYEAMKRDMKVKSKTVERKDDKKKSEWQNQPTKTGSEKRRCYNCGSEEHLSAKCPEKGKGAKCFKCNEYGHIAADCREKGKETKKETYVVSRPDKKKYMKEVSIEDCKFISLVDTGSDLTFIRSDEYARLGSPPLGSRKLHFEGFGSTGNETWGEFTKIMSVDGYDFPVTLHVVSNKVLSKHSLLLGTDFLDQVELRVKRGEVTFLQLEERTDSREVTPDIFRINVVEQTADIDLSHVEEPYYREAIRDIIRGYKPEKTRDVGITAKIVLKNDKPVVRRPRRLAPSEKKEVDDLMKVWTKEGVIRPSNSEYASPIVIVRKKDGTIRVCVDFRELNELIECPHFPLPLIEDVLDALQGAEYFTTLDLKNGFFHVRLDEGSRKYTSFVTPTGQYDFLKLPFGLKISPIVFQKYTTMLFKELIDKGILIVYMDDIIILAMTMKKKDLCLRVARWALLLGDFKYKVCHRPGKNMQHVDALSRNPLPSIMFVTENENGLIARLRSAQEKDSAVRKLLDTVTCSQTDGYVIRNNILYKDCKNYLLIVVPKAMQTQVVRQAHERGHFGVIKTEVIVKQDFWFKGLREKVEQVIANCLDCILAEHKLGKQEGYLNPLDKGGGPLDTYHIDHVGPMTATKKRYVHIFVVVDAFAKFTWLYPTKSTDTADFMKLWFVNDGDDISEDSEVEENI